MDKISAKRPVKNNDLKICITESFTNLKKPQLKGNQPHGRLTKEQILKITSPCFVKAVHSLSKVK